MTELTLREIEAYCLDKKNFRLDDASLRKVKHAYDFLVKFSADKIIYGINTGFGPMAQYKIENHQLKQLQYNLIRSHSSGMGNTLSEGYARSVVLARLNSFLQGNSGVSPDVLKQLVHFLNFNIVPELHEHGGVGASGDLVQLAHLALNLIGEGKVNVGGKWISAEKAMTQYKIKPLELKMRDGLAIINGTSCMAGIAAVNLIYAYRLLNLSVQASTIINEIMCAFDDSFSKGLNETKIHPGQREIAAQMRAFCKGSKLTRNRSKFFKDDRELQRKEFKNKIQEYYSLRCVPQILGPVLDTLDYAKKVVENEINSTSDNPVVASDQNNVYHGGNFHGDYISLEMDKTRLALTKLSMLAERQLNFLLNSKLNDKFPPFLNSGKLGFNFGLQGMQFTATSTTAENQALSNSMYVHSISSNNDNQDIVSMGTNSAVLTKNVLDNSFQVMAIHLIAVCQAIDLLSKDERRKLAPATIKFHAALRKYTAPINEDVAHSDSIRKVYHFIKESSII